MLRDDGAVEENETLFYQEVFGQISERNDRVMSYI